MREARDGRPEISDPKKRKTLRYFGNSTWLPVTVYGYQVARRKNKEKCLKKSQKLLGVSGQNMAEIPRSAYMCPEKAGLQKKKEIKPLLTVFTNMIGNMRKLGFSQ